MFSKISLQHKFFFFIVLPVTLFVFWPSLQHVPRSDQVSFLSEVYNQNGLAELIQKTYSLTRTRIFQPGDEMLFRPLFYVFLSLEKWVFGYHFEFWQLAGIILHLGVLWQLNRILLLLTSPLIAGALTLNFGVLFISQDMVIWQHIHPYMLAMILILMALRKFITYVNEEEGTRCLGESVLCLTIAAFINEFAIVCSMIFAFIFLFKRKPLKNILWLFCPLLTYATLSFLDYQFHQRAAAEIKHFEFHLWPLIVLTFRIIATAVWGSLGPMFIGIEPRDRLLLKTFSWDELLKGNDPFLMLNGLVVVLGSFLLGWLIFLWFKNWKLRERKSEDKIYSDYLIVGILLVLSYTSMFVVGRSVTRGIEYYRWNLYYFYPIILFGLIAVVSLVRLFVQELGQKKFKFKNVLIVFIGLCIFLNACQNFSLNQLMSSRFEGISKDPSEIKNVYAVYVKIQEASLEFNKGDYQSALNIYNEVLEKHQSNPEAYNNRGMIWRIFNRVDLALEDYDKALSLDKNYTEAYNNRGNALAFLGRIDEAISDYSQAIKINPYFAQAYRNRGIVYEYLQSHDLAIKDFAKAKSLGLGN